MLLCDALKRFRKKYKITQKQAAEIAGVTERVYQSYEYGKVAPTICRFVNDELHIRERRKDGLRGHPVERAHGEVVILPLPDSKLFGKVVEGIEGMTGIKFFVIFSVAAFHFAVVPRSKGTNLLVSDAKTSQRVLKER